jgi:hypothetical protein
MLCSVDSRLCIVVSVVVATMTGCACDMRAPNLLPGESDLPVARTSFVEIRAQISEILRVSAIAPWSVVCESLLELGGNTEEVNDLIRGLRSEVAPTFVLYHDMLVDQERRQLLCFVQSPTPSTMSRRSAVILVALAPEWMPDHSVRLRVSSVAAESWDTFGSPFIDGIGMSSSNNTCRIEIALALGDRGPRTDGENASHEAKLGSVRKVDSRVSDGR